jgi:Predicted amidophosphoribosyltransferases
VRNAFVLSEKIASQYVGKKILLVDDLMTTGATLYEAGHALLPIKPQSLSAVVACRVVS